MSSLDDDTGLRRPKETAFFSLIPLNAKARLAVKDEINKHLVSLSWRRNVASFDIGFHIGSQFSNNTLATLGRNECDIYLKPSSIARIHCSFEIDDLDNGIIMLYDRSHKQITRISSQHPDTQTKPFESRREPRKILVCANFNDKVTMGGKNGDLIVFGIEWIAEEAEIREVCRKRRNGMIDIIPNPRKAPTYLDTLETAGPSARMTPDEAIIRPGQPRVRYLTKQFCGQGSFGTVWRVIDVDCGRLMAMKIFHPNRGPKEDPYLKQVHREVELMRVSAHEHIAELYKSQGWGDSCASIEIFMRLEEGNLGDLVANNKITAFGRPEQCLKQMLSALDFLAYMGIVHRDVKPENILYSRSLERRGGYHYRLADFGVGKLAREAHSRQGTQWYMAPEILRLSFTTGAQQSPKVDVWSLFVTIAYALNVCNYRYRSFNNNDEILGAVRDARKDPRMQKYNAMVIEDPAQRASALDILITHFRGEGVADRSIDHKPALDEAFRVEFAIECSNDTHMTEADESLSPGRQIAGVRLPRRSKRTPGRLRVEKRIAPNALVRNNWKNQRIPPWLIATPEEDAVKPNFSSTFNNAKAARWTSI